MNSKSVNYKLLNFALLALIVYLVYLTNNLWLGIINKVFSVSLPFLIAFIIAYALHPLYKRLSKKMHPNIALTLIFTTILVLLGALVVLVFPVLFDQISSLFSNIIVFLQDLSTGTDLNIGDFQQTLNDSFKDIISVLGKFISDGAINMINTSISVITSALISFIISIYMLVAMDEIRASIKKWLKKKRGRTYQFIRILDHEMKSYLQGLMKIVIISFVEYSILYFIVGHPNWLMIGLLAAVSTIVPYFGGIFANIIALVTASVISTKLLIASLIITLVFSQIDGYIINPKVYGKTNKVPAFLAIFSISAGGILLGITGIIIAMPVTIILLAAYRFYKEDINDKIDQVKEKM